MQGISVWLPVSSTLVICLVFAAYICVAIIYGVAVTRGHLFIASLHLANATSFRAIISP